MSTRLPIVVIRRIIEFFAPMYDCSVLAVLALISKEVQMLAERRLYLALFLYNNQKMEMVLRSFGSRPILASYVKQLHVRTDNVTSSQYWTWFEDVLQRTSSTLQRVTLVTNSLENAHVSWILRALHNSNGTLTSLSLPFNYDRHVKAFLESSAASSLLRIDLLDAPILTQNVIPTPVDLHPDAANTLQYITASPAALCAIVPGRPVTTVSVKIPHDAVRWVDMPTTEYVLSKLAQSIAPEGVLCLDLGELSISMRDETFSLEVLHLVPHYLPNLRFIGTVNFPSFPGNDVNVYTHLYRPLTRLDKLQAIDLGVLHLPPPVDSGWEQLTACQLRTYCGTLQQINFLSRHVRRTWHWDSRDQDFQLVASSLP